MTHIQDEEYLANHYTLGATMMLIVFDSNSFNLGQSGSKSQTQPETSGPIPSKLQVSDPRKI